MTTDKARELAQQIETSVTTLATETDAARRSDVFPRMAERDGAVSQLFME